MMIFGFPIHGKCFRHGVVLMVMSFTVTCCYARHFTIISSQVFPSFVDMDVAWAEVISHLGHTGHIVPISVLASDDFINTTDVLIISSGESDLKPEHIANVIAFMKAGKPVYLQTEHLPYFSTNKAFKSIIESFGSTFEWKELWAGTLEPEIFGPYANSYESTRYIPYYWYSVAGIGDCNMLYFLELEGSYHGFQFTPSQEGYGILVSTTDQDWVVDRANIILMQNIIVNLLEPPSLPANQQMTLGPDRMLCEGEWLLLDPGVPALSYEWQDHSSQPIFMVGADGEYWLSATLECGVVADTILIDFALCPCSVALSNVFTPNGDSVNDNFSTSLDCIPRRFNLELFDRWGNLVFSASDPAQEWDGTHQGKPCAPGVYVYSLSYQTIDQREFRKHGDITLIR